MMFTALALTVFLTGPATVFASCVGDSGYLFEFGETVTENCTFDGPMARSDSSAFDPTGHGLIIGADNITIDGNGYCLDGEVKNCIAGEDNDAGIYFVADNGVTPVLNNVTIKNLEIKNFCHGVYLSGDPGSGMPADDCIIECCDIHDNGVNESEVKTGGIWQNNVWNSFIRNCKVYKNEGDPTATCPPGGFGIYLCAGDNNEWSGNEVYENRKAGMFFRGMPKGTWVHHNYAHDNNFAGIRGMCIHTSDSLVEYNYCINDNVGPGIMFGGPQLWTDEPNIVRHNVCRGNKTYGIEFSRNIISNKGECYENTACDNLGGYDIYVKAGVTIPGDCNTCDNTYNYDDISAASGCLYACGDQPTADFSYEATGLSVVFTDTSVTGSDPIDSYYWDFGDCSVPGTSTDQNPTHLYTEVGTYTVCLTVTDNKACPTGNYEGRTDTICKEVEVTGGGEDSDGDGVPDSSDNCRLTPNPFQGDTDSDGYGNWCDCDLDNNEVVGMSDYSSFCSAWQTSDPHSDFDCDGIVGMSDYGIFCSRWLDETPFE